MTLSQIIVGRTVTFNSSTRTLYGSTTGIAEAKGQVYVLVRLTTTGELKHCLPANISSQSAN